MIFTKGGSTRLLDQGLIIHIYYNFKVSQEEGIQNFSTNTEVFLLVVYVCFAHLHRFSYYFFASQEGLSPAESNSIYIVSTSEYFLRSRDFVDKM